MIWADFDIDTALERDVLQRCLSLAQKTSDGTTWAVIDMQAGSVNGGGFVAFVVGHAAPSDCIELLQIRPLLFGTAWEVLDIMLEAALAEGALVAPGRFRRWSISEKVNLAKQKAVPKPAALSTDVWHALLLTYANTSEMRHSLTHRRVSADLIDGSLHGVQEDKTTALPPVGPAEQEALGRAALRAAELLITTTPTTDDERGLGDLKGQLGFLFGIHGIAMPPLALGPTIPKVTVIIDPNPDVEGKYLLDMTKLRQLNSFKSHACIDVAVQLRDQPGIDLVGRLEAMPEDGEYSIDPQTPPSWLQ
jgi:hypothetical protein